ncbi:MAG: SMI1/KNR4 family protein [Candidatus Limnocylindrales bacterium]
MTESVELARLVALLPRAQPADPGTLAEAGRMLGIEWPAEYVSIVSEHNGVEGDIGDWLLVLTPVEELVEQNTNPVMEFFLDLVIIGGDGGGEALAIDRATHEILLVPWIGGEEDWLVLGRTLTEAFQRMERGEVFDAPHRPSPPGATTGR